MTELTVEEIQEPTPQPVSEEPPQEPPEEPPQEPPEPEVIEEPAELPPEPAPKRRGRPPGSKNKVTYEKELNKSTGEMEDLREGQLRTRAISSQFSERGLHR